MTSMIGSVLVVATMFAGGQSRDGSSAFAAFTEALNKKPTLSASIKVQQVGGSAVTYQVAMKKPGFLRVDKPSELFVADGTQITVFDKKDKVFYKKAQTSEDLKLALKEEGLNIVAPFFDAKAIAPTTVRDLGTKSIAGENVRVLEAVFGSKNAKVVTLYVPTNNLLKRAQVVVGKADSQTTSVISAQMGDSVTDSFAFQAPDGATEISYEDLISSRWITDFDEAMLVAKRTGKKVFVDFMADWCGPCKQMDREVFVTSEFKALGKKLVFCKVNIDYNPALADKYKVDAIPNMHVMTSDAQSVGSILGAMDTASFMSKINGILGQ